MMREATARNIEMLREKVADRVFFEADAKGIVSIQTLRKYDLIESVEIVDKVEISVDELVALANELLEEIYEDAMSTYDFGIEKEAGKIYKVKYSYGYRMK